MYLQATDLTVVFSCFNKENGTKWSVQLYSKERWKGGFKVNSLKIWVRMTYVLESFLGLGKKCIYFWTQNQTPFGVFQLNSFARFVSSQSSFDPVINIMYPLELLIARASLITPTCLLISSDIWQKTVLINYMLQNRLKKLQVLAIIIFSCVNSFCHYFAVWKEFEIKLCVVVRTCFTSTFNIIRYMHDDN